MFYRGKITEVDFEEKIIRVWLPDFFDEGLQFYPKASVSYSLHGNDMTGVFDFIKVDMWVWCFLEKGDPQYPVISGFIKEKQDFPTRHTEETILSIINKQYGITFELDDTNDNVLIKHDGKLLLPTENDYKDLLIQINDTNDAIKELQEVQGDIIDNHNTLTNIFISHTHPAVLAVAGASATGSTTPSTSNATTAKIYTKSDEDNFDIEFKEK